MTRFIIGIVLGVLVTASTVLYIEFTMESSGGVSPYVDPAIQALNNYLPTPTQPVNSPALSVKAGEEAKVLRVIDGDTIDVEINGERQRVRYIGMNTPERGEPCFEEATEANQSMVQGRTVSLVKDTSETDRFGRLLRYVYVGDAFVNEELVRQGYAEAALYRPDDRYYELFRVIEEGVAGSGLGCHATGVFDDGDARR